MTASASRTSSLPGILGVLALIVAAALVIWWPWGTREVVAPRTDGKIWRAVDPASHEFGEIDLPAEGTATLRHVFRFQNISTSRLEWVDATTSCGCASVKVTPQRIEPGAGVEIEMTMELSMSGRRSATGWVRFDDGHGIDVHVVAVGRRFAVLRCEPSERFPGTSDSTFTLRLVYTMHADLPLPDEATVLESPGLSGAFDGWNDAPADTEPSALKTPAENSETPRVLVGTLTLMRVDGATAWPRDVRVTVSGADAQLVPLAASTEG